MKFTKLLWLVFALIILLNACTEVELAPVNKNTVTISGKEYGITKIGTKTWTTLNYAGPGGVAYDAANTKPHYGKYYTKAELENIVLPEGWRIPTMNDYIDLADYYNIEVPSIGGDTEEIKSLTATTSWKNVIGNNNSGFNAYAAGYAFGNYAPMDGDIAEFWTSEGYSLSIQESGLTLSQYRLTFYDNSNSADFRFNVRFVKD